MDKPLALCQTAARTIFSRSYKVVTAHKELINTIPQEDKRKPNLKPLAIYFTNQIILQ